MTPRAIRRRRKEDDNLLIKAAIFAEKYRIIAWILGAGLIAFGFQYKTPAAVMLQVKTDLQSQIDTLKQEYISSEVERRHQGEALDFLTRFTCSSLTDADKYKLGGSMICAAAAH